MEQMESPPAVSPDELRRIRRAMIEKPLLTENFLRVEKELTMLHESVLEVADVSREWSPANRAPSKAVVIVAASRTGKTHALEHSLHSLKPLASETATIAPSPILIKAPPVMTIEALGRDLLTPMNLVPARALGPSLTIERLRTRIALRQPTMMAIDHAEWLLSHDRVAAARMQKEIRRTFGILRDLMDFNRWPVPIVLCGTLELATALESDDLDPFDERKTIIHLEPMRNGSKRDQADMSDALNAFAKAAQIDVEVATQDQFFDRLIFATNFAAGLAFEFCQDAILAAKADRESAVRPQHFATCYARKTGAASQANPFKTNDWSKVDPTRLLSASVSQNLRRLGEARK